MGVRNRMIRNAVVQGRQLQWPPHLDLIEWIDIHIVLLNSCFEES